VLCRWRWAAGLLFPRGAISHWWFALLCFLTFPRDFVAASYSLNIRICFSSTRIRVLEIQKSDSLVLVVVEPIRVLSRFLSRLKFAKSFIIVKLIN
jgi:hypothetical protein